MAKDTLAMRIRQVRLWSGRSLRAFADAIGVSRSYLSEVENQKGKPSIEMLVGIARKFPTISPKWLLTGFGEMEIEKPGSSDREALRVALSLLRQLDKEQKATVEDSATFVAMVSDCYLSVLAQCLQSGTEYWNAKKSAVWHCENLAESFNEDLLSGRTAIGSITIPLRLRHHDET